MEVVRTDFGIRDLDGLDMLCFYVNNTILPLQRPSDAQKATLGDNDTITLELIRRNDHVGNSCLIFQGKKDKALCCSGPLTGNHTTGNANGTIVFNLIEFICREIAFVCLILHGCRPWGEDR